MPTVSGTPKELEGRRSGSGDYGTGDRTFTRVWSVKFTDNTATSIDAENATGIPVWGEQLTSYNLYVFNKSSKVMEGNPQLWEVTTVYSVPKINEGQVQPRPAPLGVPADIWSVQKRITYVPTEMPVTKDKDGKITVNCLGELITPQPTIVVYEANVVITFMTDIVMLDIPSCLGKINNADVTMDIGGASWTFTTGTLLFQSFEMVETNDVDGNIAGQYTYNFAWRGNETIFPGVVSTAWNPANYPNWSTNYNKGATTPPTVSPILADITKPLSPINQPTNVPQYLGATGQPLATAATIVENSFNFYYVEDFTGLLTGLI